jgi:hypothetical protein
MALRRQRDPQPRTDWRAHYQIENPSDVETYVAEYPIIASILAAAPDQIAAAFEEHPRLILSCEFDLEDFAPIQGFTDTNSGPRSVEDEALADYLTVDIMTERDAEDAFVRLNRFDESWWLDVIQHVARAGAAIVFYPRFT